MKKKLYDLFRVDGLQLTKNFVFIIIGSLITAIGINAFLVPHKFLSPGVSGLAQFFSYLSPLSVGTYVLLLNIPIFVFGFKYVSRSFVLGSLVGTITLTVALYATEWMAHTGWAPERLLSAMVGGALAGGGTGFVFRINSSHGGTDILAAAIRESGQPALEPSSSCPIL